MKTHILNVGLVGFGTAGRIYHVPLIQAAPGLELTVVVASDVDKVHGVLPDVQVHAKAQALFADPIIDLVVIASPNESHFPLAKAALAAGKHVVVDAPMTVTLAEARLLKSQSEQAGRLLSVFHNHRWDSDFLTLAQLVQDQRLGRVVSLTSRLDRFRPEVTDRWRESPRPGSGIWYDLGAHLLDQVVLLFGMPRAILLELGNQREGATIDDDFLALLDYDGLRVTLGASSLVAEPTPRFSVNGTLGSHVTYGLDPQEAWLAEGREPEIDWGQDPSPGWVQLAERTANDTAGEALRRHEVEALPGNYRAYYDAIAQSLLHGAPPPVTIEQAIDVMTLLETGLDSYRQARWVRLKEGNPLVRRLHGG
jgi:predicted dehydrogenase